MKVKFRFSIPAGDGNIFTVTADDGFYDIQTQAPAVPVETPALVDFMKPVEYQGELLRGNGVAGVGDGDVYLTPGLPKTQPSCPPGCRI